MLLHTPYGNLHVCSNMWQPLLLTNILTKMGRNILCVATTSIISTELTKSHELSSLVKTETV